MATLVLGAVGTLIGGPIGGAIGAAIGNSIDQSLFSPRRAVGPRLGSLAVQGSSYGAPLPRLFGTMRVAGTVIWATDLREEKHKSGGGKGKPKTMSYTYSASFAVALSARPIVAVRRIWADGNLLRGAGGDWKSDVASFRVHLGDEGQAVDPLIASAEGAAGTPAYRGLAYAVFEGLELADFGNRIPSLSFEVEADAGAVTLGAIAATLADVDGPAGPALVGYAASGDSVRGAIEALGRSLPVELATDGDRLRLIDETAPAVAIAADALGAASGDARAARLTVDRDAAGTLNGVIAIDYYDPARDFQTGSQRARRGAAGRRTGTIELPAAVDAAVARGFAEARLAREWAERERATVTLAPCSLDLPVGAIVTLPGEGGRWRVAGRTIEGFVVRLEAVRLPGGGAATLPASAGRAVSEPDLAAGATTVALLDLPTLGDQPSDQPTLLIAAAGASAGWRRASVIGSIDGGLSWQTIGQTAPAAVMGTTLSVLADGDAALIDASGAVDVELLADDMALTGDDRLGWSAETNLVLIGEELVQFGAAQAIAPRRYRLSRLLRGRRGTERAAAGHRVGEPFVLIEADTVLAWSLPASAIGATAMIAATGPGDVEPATAQRIFEGLALRPPPPVHGTASAAPGGGVALAWTRRSRAGWAWLDGSDAPLGEPAERYRVDIARGGTNASFETATPALTLDEAAPGAGPAVARVVQLGGFGASPPSEPIMLATGD